MTPNDQVLAFIRTYVPYGIGAAAAWLLVAFAIQLPDELLVAITALLVAVAQNLYYLAFRLLERIVPGLGWFLGFPKTPEYTGIGDLWASVVRTGIPTLAGAIIGGLIAIGLQLDAQSQTGLIVIIVGIIQAIYYAVAKLLVGKFPALRWLLLAVEAPRAYVEG